MLSYAVITGIKQWAYNFLTGLDRREKGSRIDVREKGQLISGLICPKRLVQSTDYEDYLLLALALERNAEGIISL